LWLLVGLVFALLAAFVGMAVVELRVQQSVTAAGPAPERQATVAAEAVAPVVVASSQISSTRAITEADVSLQEWPVGIIPEGAASTVEEVVGKIAMADVYPGEAVMTIRLADPDVATDNVAFTMDPEMVVFALPPEDLMSKINLLRPGDLIDILFSMQPKQEVKATPGVPVPQGEAVPLGDPMFTTDVIQAQRITAIVVESPQVARQVTDDAAVQPTAVPPTQALLLAMPPQDALLLKYFQDAGGIMTIVLRHRTNEVLFDVEAVNYDYIKDRYGLPTEDLLPVQ